MVARRTPASPKTRRVTDVMVHNHGSVFLFTLLTPAAEKWVEDNVQVESYQWFAGQLAVEHRYAQDLAAGMVDAGLTVR